jgi:hypothetical protein
MKTLSADMSAWRGNRHCQRLHLLSGLSRVLCLWLLMQASPAFAAQAAVAAASPPTSRLQEAGLEQPARIETGRRLLTLAALGPDLQRVSLDPAGPPSAAHPLLLVPVLGERPRSQRLESLANAGPQGPARVEQAFPAALSAASAPAIALPPDALCDLLCTERTLAASLAWPRVASAGLGENLLQLAEAPESLLLPTALARQELLALVARILLPPSPLAPGLSIMGLPPAYLAPWWRYQRPATVLILQHGVHNKVWIKQ